MTETTCESSGVSSLSNGQTTTGMAGRPGQPRPSRGGFGLLGVMALAALSGCQASPALVARGVATTAQSGQHIPGKQEVALLSVPPCEDGATATLRDGLTIRYEGAAPGDPSVCVVSWQGRSHHFLAGFWGSGRYRRGASAEHSVIRGALTGPVGTRTSFEDTRADLWGTVTGEHLANPMLHLKDGPRRTVQLRIVRHDTWGRPEVKRVALHWIDVRTGVALKRQTVTQLASGQELLNTTWRVEQLREANS